MVKMIDMTSALKQVREGLNKDDEKTIKPIIKQLQKSVAAHSAQAKQLKKDISDEKDLEEQKKDLDEVQIGNIRLARDSYNKATKLPTEFVAEMAMHKSKSQISWTRARAENDFSIFRDDLSKMVEMSRKKADYLGYDEVRYDALLDLYESGLTVSKVDPLFAGLRENVAPLVKRVIENGKKPDMSWVQDDSIVRATLR